MKGHNKMKVIVIDTETTNSLEEPICYDIGFTVLDKESGEIEDMRSYVVADIFLDKSLMDSAYFKDKIPQYWEEIKSGKRVLTSWYKIAREFRNLIKENEIEEIYAHNMRFDYRALNLSQRFITCSKFRYFFPYGMRICDTLKMARETLKDSKEYREFCLTNGFVTSKNQNRYTAEVIYRYLTNDLDFEEAHTGLEDVLIEKEILKYCLSINSECDGLLW
jgi:DNA polymerase III epsilon subunit-like protein